MRSLSVGDLDKFELLASYGRYPVVVMGDPQAADFELVALADAEGSKQKNMLSAFKARGLRFIGIFAILDAGPRTAFVELLDAAATDTLATAYAHSFLAQHKDIPAIQSGDSLRFLEALWALRAPHPEN